PVAGDRGRLAVRLEHLAAVAPEDRPEGRVGVGAVADRDADRVALLLQDFAVVEQLRPRLGRLEPRLHEVGLVVGGRERDPEPGDGLPPGRGLTGLLGERVPATVLLAELTDQ